MDNAFGDALTIEMGHLFEEQKIFENDRASRTDRQ
jgi:hypothetical protein